MNPPDFHWTTVVVFLVSFLAVTGLGFFASRLKSGKSESLADWGLGGRKFGVVTTWFLVGGDFYTAYTVIAIPALVYAVGAYGFFALPYTIIVYPFVFAVMPRLWTICKQRDYMTAPDFIQGRYDNAWLTLAVAVTSLIATIPYIALQMVGIQVIIANLGLGEGWLPLVIAFLILAIYTYHSGIKAPAMIAFGKDIMIYIVVIAAVIWIPLQLGGYGKIFAAADRAFQLKGGNTGLILQPGQILPYATMALGSALAAFMYPHTMTGVLSSSGADTIRWNAILLPAYTVLLGLIALLGYMAIAADIHAGSPSSIVPLLFIKCFPDWFVGFAFAAIAIGALVPAAIMAIGSANIFTRNIWETYVTRHLPDRAESNVAKKAAMAVLLAALAFVILLPTQYAIDLQLIGTIWILQIFPAVVFGLYRTRLRAVPLLAGWATGLTLGAALTVVTGLKPIISVSLFGQTHALYIGFIALVANLLVSFGASFWVKRPDVGLALVEEA